MLLDVDLTFDHGSPVYGARFLEWIGCVPSDATGEPYAGGRLHRGYGAQRAAVYTSSGSDAVCGFISRKVISSSVATIGHFQLLPNVGSPVGADLVEWSVLARVQGGTLTGNGTADVRYVDITGYQFRVYLSGANWVLELRKYVSGVATTLASAPVPASIIDLAASGTFGIACVTTGTSPVTVQAQGYFIAPGSGQPSAPLVFFTVSDSSSPISADGRVGFTMGTHRTFTNGTGTDVCRALFAINSTGDNLYREIWQRNDSAIALVGTSPSDGFTTGQYLQGRFTGDQFTGSGAVLSRDTSVERVYMNLNSGTTNYASANLSLRAANSTTIQHRQVRMELENSSHTSLGGGVVCYASATSVATSTTGETGLSGLRGYAVFAKHTTSGDIYTVTVYRYDIGSVSRLASLTSSAPSTGAEPFPLAAEFDLALECYPTDQQGGFPDASVTIKVYIDGAQVAVSDTATTPLGVTIDANGTIIDASAGRIAGGPCEGLVASGATGGDFVYFDDWEQLTLHVADPGEPTDPDEQPTLAFGDEGTAVESIDDILSPAWSVDVDWQHEPVSVQFESGHRSTAPRLTDASGAVWARRLFRMSSPPLTLADREALLDFYIARKGAEEPFFFTDPRTSEQITVHFAGFEEDTHKAGPGTHYVDLVLEELVS